MANGVILMADVTVKMFDIVTVGDLREYMRRIEKMPNDAQVKVEIPHFEDGQVGAGLSATWKTSNPL